jgi:glycosyltransferase involved in cell wall biosynthesis
MTTSSRDGRSTSAALPVSVCVPSTRWDTVGATVAAIRAQTWLDWELLVLGQGNPATLEDAVMAAAEGDRRVHYIQLDGRGLSLARNAALEHAAGAAVAFTDDDCEPQPEWLATIAQAFLDHPDLGLVGGAVLAPADAGLLSTCPTSSPQEALYEPSLNGRRPPAGWDWIGANFAVRRSVASRTGRFDECLGAGADFPAGEDTDYKLRLEAAGIPMLTTPRAAVVHTYGVRRGWAVLRSQRNYATGNGAMAAKLTLQGDSRGKEWLDETRRGSVRELRAPHRGFRALRRWHYFSAAYSLCLKDYRVEDGLLHRI